MPYFRHVQLDAYLLSLYIWDDNVSCTGSCSRVVVAWLLLLLLGSQLSCIVLLTWVFPCSSWLPFNTLFCTSFMPTWDTYTLPMLP